MKLKCDEKKERKEKKHVNKEEKKITFFTSPKEVKKVMFAKRRSITLIQKFDALEEN